MKHGEDSACAACRGELPVLGPTELERERGRLSAHWRVRDLRYLERDCSFPDFRQALAFANRVGDAAEILAHHPEIHVSWGRARLTLTTYRVNGLTEADLVLAEMIDRLMNEAPMTAGAPHDR